MNGRVYVGNIPWTSKEDDLMQLFSSAGSTSAKIVTDRETGRSRGFAFVDVADVEKACSEFDGKDYNGRTLKVNPATEKKPVQRY